jgi:hypothetical protein
MTFLLPIIFVSHLIAQRIPASTHLAVRLDRTVSSRNARIGDRVRASLDQDMFVGGRGVAHAGARVVAKVTYVRRSGRLHHPGYLTLRLDSINIRGRRYRLQSTAIRDEEMVTQEAMSKRLGAVRAWVPSLERWRAEERELYWAACSVRVLELGWPRQRGVSQLSFTQKRYSTSR